MLFDEKSYKNILVYGISYRTLIGEKPLCIRFDNVDGLIRVYHGTRYLVLFNPEKYAIYHRIRYFKGQKIGVTYVISHKSKLIHIILCL